MMTYIKKIEITAFGKFKNYVMEFESGLNEFILDNEYGKSTITDFIIFMLYGFTKTNSKKIALENNLLQKYIPWDGEGAISGALELIHDSESYRIERRQLQSGRMKLTVYNAAGSELPLSGTPGEHFLGIDAETFLRTFLMRQNDMKFLKTDGIETALKNLVTTGDEDTSFGDAMDKLRKKKSKFQHGERRSGRIYDIQKELAALEFESAALRTTLESFDEITRMADSIEEGLKKLQAERTAVLELMPKAEASDAKRLIKKADGIKAQIAEYEAKLKAITDNALTDEKLADITKVFDTQNALKIRIAENKAICADKKAELEKAINGCPLYNTIKQNEAEVIALTDMKPHANPVLGVMGVIIMMLGAALAASVSGSVGIIICIPGIILAALAMVLRVKVKIPEKYGCTQDELKLQYSVYLKKSDVIDALSQMLRQSETEVSRLEDECSDIQNTCKSIAEEYGITSKADIARVMAEHRSADIIESQLSALNAQYASVTNGKDMTAHYEIAKSADAEVEYTADELRHKLLRTDNEINDYTSRLNELKASGYKRDETQKQIFYNEVKREKLANELENAKYSNSVFDIAIDAMQKAYDRINSMYSTILTQNAAQPLKEFTNGKYDKVYLDRDFEIRVKADGELQKLGFFSKGTTDAVYFAIRTAIADMIADGKSLPIIMDDPFWSLDDTRLENARKYIKMLAKKQQIIIFAARK